MAKKYRFILLLLILTLVQARTTASATAKPAYWIAVPQTSAHDYGVYYFRKNLNLTQLPAAMRVEVSGDNRYELYVNGQLASAGPAKGDLHHWHYETVDLKPYLKPGNNVVAAMIINEGEKRALSLYTHRTAFYLHALDAIGAELNTDPSWLCIQDRGYQPLNTKVAAFMAVGPCDILNMHQHIAHWCDTTCDLSKWRPAQVLALPAYADRSYIYGYPSVWQLMPSTILQMERRMERMAKVRQSTLKLPKTFLNAPTSITIPAHTKATILIDNKQETNAYVHLAFGYGRDAEMSLTYSECLWDDTKGTKSNRNVVNGKLMRGVKDSIISNGKERQIYRTLSWRTYRYVQLTINTHDAPLTLYDLYGIFTGYPLQLASTFECQDKELERILQTGWHTARLCAWETYMDCPYYEQLQYLGDSRIQALITLFNSRDDRLVKSFLDMADWSRRPEGFTMSQYPSTMEQNIPTYSLIYILSLHDYMRYGSDLDFVRGKLSGVRQILDYFKTWQLPDGRLKETPGWNFIDWVAAWGDPGEGPKGSEGATATADLFLLLAYQAAADLESQLGMPAMAKLYETAAQRLAISIRSSYWNTTRGLFADDSNHRHFSQHTNALAILAKITKTDEITAIAHQLLEDKSLAPCSVYFSFYLNSALHAANLGDNYLQWLDIYRENIKQGLTTWAETSDLAHTRSDCHAWGAAPNIEVYRIMLGIESTSPGFASVRIAPHPGNCKQLSGSIPHPQGNIRVNYRLSGQTLKAVIELPEHVSGEFVWRGKIYPLHGGRNENNYE